ncbi:hypothetical protein KR009_002838 [Drosophila setifemur]|nr:hypothetical protein KR009_002838 [Drosophila setifemur]
MYSVMAPNTIRSNMNYNVAVAHHNANQPSRIRISINGPSYHRSKEVQLQPLSTNIISFDVPKIGSGDYRLTAEGLIGVVFKNSTKITYAHDKPSIYVQTDKATYKPGDLVQFRVIFVDRHTRPARIDKPISIEIRDGDQNQIKQWAHIRPTKGVYSGELQLSEQPVLGAWEIAVSVQGESSMKKAFQVDKYVMPKFEVIVETSENVVAADGNIKATIRAKYTFGKAVKGKATVAIEGGSQAKAIEINGKVNVELPFAATAKSPLKIVAVVTEELTDLKQNGSAYVSLHQHRYRLEAYQWPKSYGPEKTLSYPIVVRNVDGSPVARSAQKVLYTFSCCGSSHNIEAPVSSIGIATANVQLPDTSWRICKVTAKLENAAILSKSISRLDKSLKIELNTANPKLKEKMSLDVVSTSQLPPFMLTIVARGNILFSQYVPVPQGATSKTLQFPPTFDMVPQASIYVHYVVGNVMRFEMQTVEIEKEFGNSIEISAPANAGPSDMVRLRVKTDPRSFVGLLGVDQSVLLLRSGNDLDRDQIFADLGKHTTPDLVTMTNANIYTEERWGMLKSVTLIMQFSETCSSPNSRFMQTINPLGTGMSKAMSPSSDSPTTTQPSLPPPRKLFPETWLFTNISDMGTNDVTLLHRIPDTITSWVITGFSLNPISGIALTKSPNRIRVFKPFFVSTNLPYSVKRGEIIAIPVVVFNFMNTPVMASVTLDNSDQEYEFVENTRTNFDQRQRVRSVSIPAHSGRSFSFMIRPKKIGMTTLKITARCPLAGDILHQNLKVEADGVTKYVNRPVFVNLKSRRNTRSLLQPEKTLEKTLDVELPPDVVPGSEVFEFEVGGDIQAPTIDRLDDLVRLPTGCGEQNMFNFVPNILVLRYLDATNNPDPKVHEKAKGFLNTGYQRELTYKRDDGSFSAFGKNDVAGSTWLTAYVIRSFHQAAKYTNVDDDVLNRGLQFLVSRQQSSGEFRELGKVIHFDHGSPLVLTSFVLLAFFENQEHNARYQHVIDKGVNFVAAQAANSEDQYGLAIAALALQLARHPMAQTVMAKLERKAKHTNDCKWWSKSGGSLSGAVEITSYVLLAQMEHGMANSPMPIVQWLIEQRNSNGGFVSSQDTVVGLQALTKFALESNNILGRMDIEILPPKGPSATLLVRPERSLTLQTFVLPTATRKFDFRANGTGTALTQLSYRYNVAEREPDPSFKVTPTVKDSSGQRLVLDICAEYTPVNARDRGKKTNMALMEIQLPSGYVNDNDNNAKIKAVDQVKRVETKNGDTQVIVYFDSLTPKQSKCLTVVAARIHAVAQQKPAYVKVYDYYATERSATEYYHVSSSICDICEGTDCGPECLK